MSVLIILMASCAIPGAFATRTHYSNPIPGAVINAVSSGITLSLEFIYKEDLQALGIELPGLLLLVIYFAIGLFVGWLFRVDLAVSTAALFLGLFTGTVGFVLVGFLSLGRVL